MVISLTILLAIIGLCLFCFKDPIPSINIKNEEGFTLLFKPLNKLSIRLPNGTLLQDFEFDSIKKEFFRPYFNNRDLGHFVILLSDRIIVERRWFAEQQAFHVFPLTKKQYEKVYRHFQKLALR
jgi:hypothetical protein